MDTVHFVSGGRLLNCTWSASGSQWVMNSADDAVVTCNGSPSVLAADLGNAWCFDQMTKKVGVCAAGTLTFCATFDLSAQVPATVVGVGMATHPGGAILASEEGLYQIDRGSGAKTQIASGVGASSPFDQKLAQIAVFANFNAAAGPRHFDIYALTLPQPGIPAQVLHFLGLLPP
jgi:hypothetical protein